MSVKLPQNKAMLKLFPKISRMKNQTNKIEIKNNNLILLDHVSIFYVIEKYFYRYIKSFIK